MSLRRRAPPPAAVRAGDSGPDGAEPAQIGGHAAPGLELALSSMPDGRSGRVLDLGPAVPDNVAVLAPRSARLQVVDLMRTGAGGAETGVLAKLLPGLAGSFDLILAWDVLDYLPAEEAVRVVAALSELCASGGLLHLLVAATDTMPAEPARFRILAGGRLQREVRAPGIVGAPDLAPAQVERLLAGFRVEHAFVLSHGVREYVATRTDG